MTRITLSYMRTHLEPEVADIVEQLELALNDIYPEGVTSTDLQDQTHWINSRVKTHSLMVTTTDTNVTVWSSGKAATAPWVNASGVNVYVPL